MADERRRQEHAFRREVAGRAERKRRARARDDSVWFGLGMFGVVGWSVVLPTLLGIALGLWLDDRIGGGGRSWTLTGLGLGLGVGCVIAWQWVRREGHHRQESDHG
jgi:ATP synthase protein I